jgi:cysteine-rich repeat protein
MPPDASIPSDSSDSATDVSQRGTDTGLPDLGVPADGSSERSPAPSADCGSDAASCDADVNGGPAVVGGPCAALGALACNGAAQRLVLVCDNGTWSIAETCATGMLCDRRSAACATVVPECASKAPGQAFCDGAKRRICGADLVTTDDEVCSGSCAPDTATCTGASCGDGKVQAASGEACDLGMDNNAAAYGAGKCTDLCLLAPRCGDAKVDGAHGEFCDDGKNDGAPGGCTTDCKAFVALPSCGDGTVQPPEQCDTGSNNGGAASVCDAHCKLKCGNGAVDTGEECDDGAANNTGAYGKCAANCKLGPRCGDSIVQSASEQCDDGASNGSATSKCDSRCRLKCGNGVVEPGEQCDDGTLSGAYAGCNANCTKAAFCGDGVKNGPEQCDLGTAANTGSYGGCNANCTLAPHCGDAHTDSPQEQCDDGNGSNADVCLTTCKSATCGDGFVFAAATGGQEECDDAARNSNTGPCLLTCKRATCGDGFIQTGVEECDDRNAVSGDGCDGCHFSCISTDTTRNCAQANPCLRSACGTNHQCSTPAATNEGGACTSGAVNGFCRSGVCQPASCGNGLLETGEQCDDANMVSTDACIGCKTATCGDGFVRASVEQCDLGTGNSNTAACLTTCRNASCGDGFVQAGVEQCDLGTGNSNTAACLTTCRNASCGDGFVQAGVEQCDLGTRNSNTGACLTNCRNATCGDGFVQAGVEECDDVSGSCTRCRFTCLASDPARNCSTQTTACAVFSCGATHTCSSTPTNEGGACPLSGGTTGLCRSGLCAACSTGLTVCGNSCVNLASDANNCGACAMVCPAGHVCQRSSCVCPIAECGGICRSENVSLACTGGTTSCASWDFESASIQGWRVVFVDLGPPQPPLTVSMAHPAPGSTRSLSLPFNSTMTIEVPLCAGGTSNVAGKQLSLQFYLETNPPGLSLNTAPENNNQVFAYLTTAAGLSGPVVQTFFDPAPGSGSAVPTNAWVTLRGTILPNATAAQTLQLGVLLDFPPTAWVGGTFYIDNVEIF